MWRIAVDATSLERCHGADSPPDRADPDPAPPTATKQAPEDRWDYAFIPLVFYAPETSLGFAAGIALFDDAPSPPGRPRRDDSLAVFFQGTLRKQFTVSLSGVKFWDSARYQLTEDAAVLHFPNTYWGLGNETPDGAQDPYTQSGVVTRASFAVRVAEEIYAGAAVGAGWYDTAGGAPGGAVEAYSAVTPPSGSAFGVGPVIRRDTRDDALGPHNGSLTSLAATFFPMALGGTYRFESYELDHRSYITLGSRSVLALEGYALYALGHVPIAELPALGGSARLRGYYQGRYRDHLYVMGQLEWRIRVAGRFSVAPFGGAGNVFPTASALSFDGTKVAGGLALRFNLKKERDLNVHIDIAKSPTSSGIYLNMGEAF